MIWLVEARKPGGEYLGLAISWAFESLQAAQWWIDNRADKSMGWLYHPAQFPLYDLKTIQEFTA